MGAKATSRPRRTVRGEASLEGVGIHTGARTKLTFRAAPSGSGIAFRRTDLASQPVIPARPVIFPYSHGSVTVSG